MKQMTNGMVTGRGFFPGKGGRRGFPMIGDEFAYFPHDKPFHDFGPYPNFPPPDAGFFPPGPMGFMGHPPGNIYILDEDFGSDYEITLAYMLLF